MSPALRDFVHAFDHWRAAPRGSYRSELSEQKDALYGSLLLARKAVQEHDDFEDFLAEIEKMNRRYELPVFAIPTLPQAFDERLEKFKSVLQDEVNEVDDFGEGDTLDTLTEVADWLGDIIVYCASEALKYGIPLSKVLAIIMESNESKLGEDGKPIKDARGKFLKGPNYWKPEPRIAALLGEMRGDGGEA